MKNKEEKFLRITITAHPLLAKQIKEVADADGRSFSDAFREGFRQYYDKIFIKKMYGYGARRVSVGGGKSKKEIKHEIKIKALRDSVFGDIETIFLEYLPGIYGYIKTLGYVHLPGIKDDIVYPDANGGTNFDGKGKFKYKIIYPSSDPNVIPAVETIEDDYAGLLDGMKENEWFNDRENLEGLKSYLDANKPTK